MRRGSPAPGRLVTVASIPVPRCCWSPVGQLGPTLPSAGSQRFGVPSLRRAPWPPFFRHHDPAPAPDPRPACGLQSLECGRQPRPAPGAAEAVSSTSAATRPTQQHLHRPRCCWQSDGQLSMPVTTARWSRGDRPAGCCCSAPPWRLGLERLGFGVEPRSGLPTTLSACGTPAARSLLRAPRPAALQPAAAVPCWPGLQPR